MAKVEKNRENRHDQPLDILGEMSDQSIFVRLVDRTEVIGRLLDFDPYMNLKLELDDEEILIRGNNVILIATEWEELETAEAGSEATMAEAWEEFVKHCDPEKWDQEAVEKEWFSILSEMFPGKQPDELSAAEWAVMRDEGPGKIIPF